MLPAARRAVACVVVALLPSVVNASELRSVVQCEPLSPAVYCLIGQPTLSPDGQCLAYTDGTTWPPYYEWWPSIGLAAVDAGGCDSRNLSVPSPGGNWSFAPTWSPDGTYLAFVSEGWIAEDCGLWTLNVRLPESPDALQQIVAGTFLDEPAWSRDGGSLAYVSSGNIYTVSVSGGSSSLVISSGTSPSWGPDGELVFVRDSDLWIREVDGSERPLTQTPASEASPAWSPRGGWIAYATNRSGNWDVWVISTRGGTPVQLTSSPAEEGSPSWSASADRIVFAATLDGHDSIWLATDLPSWTSPVSRATWGAMKQLYR